MNPLESGLWINPPLCPYCNCILKPAADTWKPRGDWMCHENHDGKRIWFDAELIVIMQSRLQALRRDANTAALDSTILEIAMRDIGATKPVDPPVAKDPEPAAPSPYRDTKLRYYEFAFPLMPSKEMWEVGIGVQNGMTLHDWFAGQAMAGRLTDRPPDVLAKECFEKADAMMAERARRANVT